MLRSYLPQFVYGSTDGIVTTFAIVAGAAGANLKPVAILAIGIASVLADGYSMGISSYLSKSAEESNELCRVESVSQSAHSVGIATFISFVVMGMIPIIPFMLPTSIITFEMAKIVSFILALLSFFCIGFLKGVFHEDGYPFKSGVQTFVIGLSAAIVAYTAGYYVGG